MKQYNTEPVKKALDVAKNVLILLPQNPSLDAVAAGLSLYLSLTKSQKITTIGCASDMTVNFNRLFGVDKIKSHIGNQNLIITFDYPQDQIEKIAHDQTADQRLFLTVESKAGAAPLNPDQVNYSYTGSTADLIFVIGARSLEDLGELYHQEKTLLEDKSKTIVNISNLDKNAQFGTVNLYDPTAAGSSEITLSLLKTLNLNLEKDIATNLLSGIESATNNLTQANSPDTYEVIAELMRLGAQKGHLTPQAPSSPFGQRPQGLPVSRPQFFNPQPFSPQTTPINSSGMPVRPSGGNIPETTDKSKLQGANAPQPQPDWLKPKVVTSSGAKI